MKDDNNPGQEKADAAKKGNILKAIIAMIGQIFQLVLNQSMEVIAITKDGKVFALFSKGFKEYFEVSWFEKTKVMLPMNVFAPALRAIRQDAIEKARRILQVEGNYHWDGKRAFFKNTGGKLIQVTAAGVSEINVTDSPIVFTGDQQPFVNIEEPAATLMETMRENVRLTEEQTILLIGCLIKAFLPGPNPVMIFVGDQGVGKTFLANFFKMIIDPAGTGERVRILDNISGIGGNLSDSLCRESHDHLLIVTTIADDLMLNQDLVDRTIVFHLSALPNHDRRPESMLLGKIREDLGAILHHIATALSEVAKNNNTIQAFYPRLADLTHYCTAAASTCHSLGFNANEFIAALVSNRANAVERSLNDNPVSAAIINFMDELGEDRWKGTAEELKNKLEEVVSQDIQSHSSWPSKPNKLSGMLRRATPFLRTVGLNIEWGKSGQRSITIEKAVAHAEASRQPDQIDDHDFEMDEVNQEDIGAAVEAEVPVAAAISGCSMFRNSPSTPAIGSNNVGA